MLPWLEDTMGKDGQFKLNASRETFQKGRGHQTMKSCFSLPSARTNDTLCPANHLQIIFKFEGTSEIFIPNIITSKDLTESISEDGETKLYGVEVYSSDIPRTKLNHGTTSTVEVSVYVWRREKLLGK